MKVYHIGSGYDGCYYVRCMLPLQANGWWGEWVTLGSRKESKETMFKGAMASDIVVFQRPLQKEKLEAAKLLKKAGKIIVMDNDDTYVKDSGVPLAMVGVTDEQAKEIVQTIDDGLKEFALIADLVTVSTEYLAEEYRKIGANVVVTPNTVCPEDWPKPKRNKGKKVRIGMVGSVVFSKDFKAIESVLRDLFNRKDVQLVVFGLPPKTDAYKEQREGFYKEQIDFWESLNIEWQPTVPIEKYAETLNNLELDIMLIPREDNYFNKCKSNVKFLEASMLEIPVVASAFDDSPYQADEDAIYIAKYHSHWMDVIDGLIKDKKARRQVGKEAKKYVIKKYSIDNNAHIWAEQYKKLCEKK